MSPAILAAIPVILELIAKGVPAVINLIRWIQSIRTIAKQSEEWTKEFEEAFIASLISTVTDPKYQPDPKA